MRKNLLMIVSLLALMLVTSILFAQDVLDSQENATENAAATTTDLETATTDAEAPAFVEEAPEIGGLEAMARKIVGSGLVDIFIQGGFTMWPILILLIWALANIIYKFVALQMAKKNVNTLLSKILPLVEQKKYKEASELSASISGPVATILHQGLMKADKGVEAVEKSMESAAVLEMAFLEKGFMSLATTISLAPMFGFFGTLVGMIAAFDAIEKAGEVDPTIVASGIKVALITSAAGLAVAIPVQFFNNIFLGMVDGLVIDMQKSSEKLVETIVENK
ncbi:MAG: MotA/TolQ/ExbB proton channel family protein [Candidatus Cloacimonetes bacterium]|nr:MotA/TolQ/ExbB proton channel family protein [Candidatus Cloacimonadota bacterium]